LVDDPSGDGAVSAPAGAGLWPNPEVLASIVAMTTIMMVRMFFPGRRRAGTDVELKSLKPNKRD